MADKTPMRWSWQTIESTAFGTGWISGVLSAALGLVGLGAVVCFRSPDLLTTPEARALYPLPCIRALLHLYLLGFADAPLFIYLVVVSVQATFIHANVRFDFGPLKWAATPFHHWHHADEPEAIDKNFAVHLPVLDATFGTMYLPRRWPRGYGLAHGAPVPDGYLRQFAWPFVPPRKR